MCIRDRCETAFLGSILRHCLNNESATVKLPIIFSVVASINNDISLFSLNWFEALFLLIDFLDIRQLVHTNKLENVII